MKNEKTGLACPRCKSTINRVYWTEPRPGFRSRGRECADCSHRFATRETLAGTRRPPPADQKQQ